MQSCDVSGVTSALGARAGTRAYTRIIVKAGTSLLTCGKGELNQLVMADLVAQIASLHKNKAEVMLVTSGAVAAGRAIVGDFPETRDLPQRQMLAAVGQGRLMHVYERLFSIHNIPVGQALLSRRDLSDRLGYLNVRNTLMGLLHSRIIPVINENDVVAVEELEGDVFGDNDTLSAMVANLVDADLLVLLGEVSGLHTADPHNDPNAQLIPVVEHIDEGLEFYAGPSWDKKGRGGMITKLEAARLATTSGVDVVIAGGRVKEVLRRLVDGENLGTFFPSVSSRLESRKRWMLTGLSNKGKLMVDDGAVSAVRRENRSLLPAGILGVLGEFNRGDIISIHDRSDFKFAVGITNYGSKDLLAIKGLKSDRIEKLLGYHYGDDVIHRNNMVIV